MVTDKVDVTSIPSWTAPRILLLYCTHRYRDGVWSPVVENTISCDGQPMENPESFFLQTQVYYRFLDEGGMDNLVIKGGDRTLNLHSDSM